LCARSYPERSLSRNYTAGVVAKFVRLYRPSSKPLVIYGPLRILLLKPCADAGGRGLRTAFWVHYQKPRPTGIGPAAFVRLHSGHFGANAKALQ
jgi:hypothetical protein